MKGDPMNNVKKYDCGCTSTKDKNGILHFKNICEHHKKRGLHYLALSEQNTTFKYNTHSKNNMAKKRFPVKFNTSMQINDPKLKKDFICDYCLHEFKPKDRFVVLGTYDINEILKNKKNTEVLFLNVGFVSERFYHLDCWRQWFSNQITKSVQDIQKQLLDNPAIKQAMSLVGGLVKQ